MKKLKNKQLVFLLLYKEGKNDSEIGRIINVNNVTIHNWRKEFNLPSNFKYKSKINKQEFLRLYNSGLTYNKIAKILNVSKSRINQYALDLKLENNLCLRKNPSYIEEQVLLGTLFGDGCLILSKYAKHPTGQIAHSLKLENYCKWKMKLLGKFAKSGYYRKQIHKKTKKVYNCYTVYLRASKYFLDIYYLLYNKKKYINPTLLYKLDALGVAVWFMDDGYKETCGYRIATNSFSISDLKIIQHFFLYKFDIETNIHLKSHEIYIPAKSKDKFTKLIECYIHPDCKYKIHWRPKTPLNGEVPE